MLFDLMVQIGVLNMIQCQVKEQRLAMNGFEVWRESNDIWLASSKAPVDCNAVQTIQQRLHTHQQQHDNKELQHNNKQCVNAPKAQL